ncbi:Uncharacterised protein [Bordetella pertussis]|nr:Uncharacterised protein [Bordetella pertussis]
MSATLAHGLINAGPRHFGILRGRRPAGARHAGLPAAAVAGRAGAGHRQRHRGARHPGGRGRHRHRQDLGLSGARLRARRQGADFHRHAHPAGPAVRARPAEGAAGAGRAGDGRAAQGARQLCLPLPPRPPAGRRPRLEVARRDRPAAPDPGVCRHQQDRRSRRAGAGARRRRYLATRDLHARELPGPGVPAHPRLLRGQGAPPGAGGRRGGREPCAVHGRPGAARGGRDRLAARSGYGDFRRGAPIARYRDPVPGQQCVDSPVAGLRPHAGGGRPGVRARSRQMERCRPAGRDRRARAAAGLRAAAVPLGHAAAPRGPGRRAR